MGIHVLVIGRSSGSPLEVLFIIRIADIVHLVPFVEQGTGCGIVIGIIHPIQTDLVSPTESAIVHTRLILLVDVTLNGNFKTLMRCVHIQLFIEPVCTTY